MTNFFIRGVIFILTCYSFYFVFQTIYKLPSDLINLKAYYSERKMTDFHVHGAVMGGFWLTSAILTYVFIYPVIMFVKGVVVIWSS